MSLPGFQLTRYFSLLSLIMIALAGGLLSTLVRQQELRHLEQLATDRNAAMAEIFETLLWQDIAPLIHTTDTTNTNGEAATNPTTTKHVEILDHKLKQWTRNSDIVKIKVYTLAGITAYSTERAQIGEDKSVNPGFISARNGTITSELVHRGKFSATEREMLEVDLVSSYVPIHQDKQIVAIFELYQHVTPLVRKINDALSRTGITIAGILLCLYLMQLLIVRRAQSVIHKQEAGLEKINRELDQRVEERTRDLRLSEERISELLKEQRLIFDNAHVGILVVKNRCVIRSNQRIADMFGFAEPEQYQGQSTEIFYPSHEHFEAAGKTGYAQLATQGNAQFETKMCRQDGTHIWVMQSGRPVESGTVMDGISIWVYADITELKHSETELRIAATAFESQQGMLVTDANGIILRANRKFTEITGYAADDVVGKTPDLLQSEQHTPEFFESMWADIRRHDSWQGELWGKRKNGDVFPQWVTISAVRAQDGNITHYVATYADITERKQAEEKINQLAFYDQLTGLPNRTLLLDRLGQAWRMNVRSRHYSAVLFIDLDHFNVLNDTRGHAYGDVLLQLVAERLQLELRQGDTVSRHGGDEFVIMLATGETDLVSALTRIESVCEKILASLAQAHELPGLNYLCTASIGVACFNGQSGTVDDLLRQADLAMYRSKKAGGNCFTFFDQEMETAALDHVRLSADMRQALEHNQFEVHYQAQVDGDKRHIVGAEALVRWNHPARGRVSPIEFIPHAEQTGLIIPLGKWILDDVCRQLSCWAEQPRFAELVIAVNVSAAQFRETGFVDMVIDILQRTGANPRRLKLELTESVFAEDFEEIVARMHSLKTIGIGFSIDDFGTGYSSLAYLSRMPLDQLKIDQSFVADLESNDSHVSICAATISLAHSLKLKVVAEGVETEAQRYFLGTVHRCDMLQGYLFSKPLPRAEFEQLCGSSHEKRTPALKTD